MCSKVSKTTSATMSGAEFRLLELGSSTNQNPGQNQSPETLGALAFITLSDPQKNGNALDIPLLQSLLGQLDSWASEPIRALILRSSSDIAFSVGMDFTAFQSAKSGAFKEAARLYRRLLAALDSFPTPVFCLLENPARAGGVGLVMAADLVLATEAASLNLGEALFGLIPANVLPYLRKRLGERRVNQMVFVPETLDAKTLFRWGLIDFAPFANSSDLEKSLCRLLRSVLRCSPSALALQKDINQQLGALSMLQQQDMVENILVQSLEENRVQAAISAFLDGGLGPWTAKVPKLLFP